MYIMNYKSVSIIILILLLTIYGLYIMSGINIVNCQFENNLDCNMASVVEFNELENNSVELTFSDNSLNVIDNQKIFHI